MAIAIAIDALFEDVAGQHLDHADFARPGAGGVGGQIARCMQADGGKDLGLEKFGAAAVMRKGKKRVAGVEIALDLAEVGLEGPEGQKDASGDAEFRLGPFEDGLLFAGLGAGGGQALLRDQRLREVEEGLAEDALRTVGLQHLCVLAGAAEIGFHRVFRQALRGGLGGHAVKEGREIAAAGGGPGGSGRNGCGKGKGQGKDTHHRQVRARRVTRASISAQLRHRTRQAASMASGPGSRRPSGQTQG